MWKDEYRMAEIEIKISQFRTDEILNTRTFLNSEGNLFLETVNRCGLSCVEGNRRASILCAD